MNASVGDSAFPVCKVFVLLGQAIELATTQRVLLHIVDTPFDFSLVTRSARSRGDERAAVVLAEINDLGIQFWIVPVGLDDSALGIVENDCLRHATKVPKSVFENANELLGGLSKDRFGVALSRVTQDCSKDMRAPERTVGHANLRTGAKVDLKLLAWLDLDSPEWQIRVRAEFGDEPIDRPVTVSDANHWYCLGAN
jgi:hypothetical protein